MKELVIDSAGHFILTGESEIKILAVNSISREPYIIVVKNSLMFTIERKGERFYLIGIDYNNSKTIRSIQITQGTFVNADNNYGDIELFRYLLYDLLDLLTLYDGIEYDFYIEDTLSVISQSLVNDDAPLWIDLNDYQERIQEAISILITRLKNKDNKHTDDNSYTDDIDEYRYSLTYV